MTANLFDDTLMQADPHELRMLLDKLIEGTGQYDGRFGRTLYLPLAGGDCRFAIAYSEQGNQIERIERGPAFDAAEWGRVREAVERSLLAGPIKVGRDFSFNSLPVPGWWRGQRSGVQILPPPEDAPRAPVLIAEHPFILEFPVRTSDYWPVTNRRRLRQHRSLTLLLHVLLAGRTSLQSRRSDHLWALVPRDDDERGEIRWVQSFFFAKLSRAVIDELTPPVGAPLEEVKPEEYYQWAGVGLRGDSLDVPADLDQSISRYLDLSATHRDKFDRATFWFDMAARQWNTSISASFAALVSALESLTERGVRHRFDCPVCGRPTEHEVPGTTRRFMNLLDTYAPGAALAKHRNAMYKLRSDILHGTALMQLDLDHAQGGHGFDLPSWNEHDLHRELWGLVRLALRNWLKNPPAT
jgi:hypothetical protein